MRIWVWVKFSVSKCKILPRRVDWRSLRILTIRCLQLTSGVIRRIVKGSPVLESLELYRYWFYPDGIMSGPYKLSIDYVSLKKLVIWVYRHLGYDSEEYDDELRIFAPNVLSLEIKGRLRIKKILVVMMSSLVDAKLDYNQHEYIKDDFEVNRDVLTGFLTRLKHVEHLTWGFF